MKKGLESIRAFAQNNESLNSKKMSSITGGAWEPRDLDAKYSTSARNGGDTDCVDYYDSGQIVVSY